MQDLPAIVHTLGFPIDFNGNIARIFGEAIHVAKLGIHVEVIVTNQLFPMENLKQAISNGVKIHRIKPVVPNTKIGWRINNLVSLPLETLKLASSLENSILHVAAPTPVTRPLGVSEVGRQLKKPMVLDIIDIWAEEPFSLNPVSILQTQMMRKAIKNADYVVVCHNSMKEVIHRIDRTKPVALIPNGVDIDLFKPTNSHNSLAEKVGIEDHNVVVAFCGHITKVKGLDILAHSAKIIAKKHAEVIFLIIGDGPYLEEIKDLTASLGIHDHFRFTGFVPSIVKYLSLADICVAPYIPLEHLKFVHPMKTAEYMSLEKPVVISRIPTEDNVITLSEGGIEVEPGDVSQLSSAIITLIEDEKLRKVLGKNGREYVVENLSWQKIAQRLLEIYKSLAA